MTTLPPRTWEQSLLTLAHEAWQSRLMSAPKPPADRPLLDRAYAHCEALTAQHSKSFHLATSLLPVDKRRAIHVLYAFCRVTDDIVDCDDCDAAASLVAWRYRVMSVQPPTVTTQPSLRGTKQSPSVGPEIASFLAMTRAEQLPPASDLVAVAWADARTRYHIPIRYAEQLIDGVARDLTQTRYQTFDDLAAYAYGVASTVGLMSMHIIGFSGPAAMLYAIKLGVALQITNILRDIGEDWRAGRVYLPHDELHAFGLNEIDLARGQVTAAWRDFMRFQIERNRRLYAEAWPGIALLNRDGRFAVAAAGQLYRAILDDIEAHDYDTFTRRAHVGGLRKLSQLPGIWWSVSFRTE